MATVDKRIDADLRRYSRRYGSMEEISLVLDAPRLLLLNADVNLIADIKAGDTVLSVSHKILVSGTASSTMDIGTDLAETEFQTATALDAAADTVVASDLANPYTALTDQQLTVDTDTAEWVAGRVQIVALIHRGSEARAAYEQYVGDPNTPAQLSATEAG